jgi:hypothetical protein
MPADSGRAWAGISSRRPFVSAWRRLIQRTLGIGGRMKAAFGIVPHVIVESFTSRTSSGAQIPALSPFAGTYGAAFISNLWYPAPRATTGWALRRGSTAFGSSFGFHLFEEFVPRKYLKAFQDQD